MLAGYIPAEEKKNKEDLMGKKKYAYPGEKEAEKERSRWKREPYREEDPDFIPGTLCPNYEKWPDKTPEEVLVMLNID